MAGGQPSLPQPIEGAWLSPQVVTRKRWPMVLCDMGCKPLLGPVLDGPHGKEQCDQRTAIAESSQTRDRVFDATLLTSNAEIRVFCATRGFSRALETLCFRQPASTLDRRCRARAGGYAC